MIRGIQNLLLLVILLLASSGFSSESSLGKIEEFARFLSADLHYGSGRTNKTSYPIITFVYTGGAQQFVSRLEELFAGRATVSVDSSTAGTLVSVADIYSQQCLNCAVADSSPRKNIESGIFFSLMSQGDGSLLVMGTPGIAHTAGFYQKAVYQGGDFSELAKKLSLDIQTHYRFHKNEVLTTTGDLNAGLGDFLRSMRSSMAKKGFSSLGDHSYEEDVPFSSQYIDRTYVWTRDSMVVQVRLQRASGNPQTKVEIYEIKN